MRVLAAVLTLAVLTAGCNTLLRGNWDPFQSSTGARIRILVTNETPGSVIVHVLSPTRRIPLGTIAGNGRENYSVPWSESQRIRFDIEILGGRTHVTSGSLVRPGDQVEIRVRDPVERSEVRR